ncbi:MAG: glycosyltransferase family 39 protein [Planctomycetes bacterium]|nr:glycosyltransferase family 39 protein [Planctomycetota bacterium]
MNLRTYRWGLISIVTLALFVRLYHVGGEDFWQDEIHSMYNSAGARGPVERLPYGVILRDIPRYSDLTPRSTIANVWRTMDDDSHPPLYFILLLLWRRLVGDGEAILRCMPVVFSVLSTIPAALAMRELASRRAALTTALGLALSFCHISTAQENRPYSLSGLLISISIYLLARMEARWSGLSLKSRLIHGFLYGATLYVAMMNHYFAGLVFFGQFIYAILRFRGSLLNTWCVTACSAALCFGITWGPHVLRQWNFIVGQDWLNMPDSDYVWRTLLRITNLPVRFLFITQQYTINPWNSLIGLALLVGLCAFLWQRRTRAAMIFACWYFAPLLILGAIDLIFRRQHLTHLRYPSVGIPGIVGLVALAIDQLAKNLRKITLVSLLAASLPTLYFLPAQSNPHSREAVALIANDFRSHDLLIYDAIGWPPSFSMRLYEMISYYLPFQPPSLMLREQPDDALHQAIAGFDQIYVVSPRVEGVPNPDPLGHPLGEKSDNYVRQVGWVYRFARGAPQP